MIGDGQFYPLLASVDSLLKKLGLLEHRNIAPNRHLGAADFRKKDYREGYSLCFNEFCYDFLLVDKSLLMFTRSGNDEHDGSLSYTYYECPVAILSYESFVASQFDLTPTDASYQETLDEIGDLWRIDYDDYVSSADSKTIVTPLRYDYKASDYREGIHPASHVHFGFGNEIRVGTRKVMNPVSFSLFVIRQCYPTQWRRLLQLGDEHKPITGYVRDNINNVHANYWNSNDLLELSLH